MVWIALAIVLFVWFVSGVQVAQFCLQEVGEVIRQVQGRDALYAPLGEILWAAGCLVVFVFCSLALVAINIPIL